MTTRVQKWGNSLALRIPKPLAAEVGLHDNSPVELSLCDGSLIITPAAKPAAINLDDLLARVTKKNLHGEVDTGPARRDCAGYAPESGRTAVMNTRTES